MAVKEIYQELYKESKNLQELPYYIVIGIKGESFDKDLAIPIEKAYLKKTLRQFIKEYILDKDEESVLESLQLGNITQIDKDLKQKIQKTFNSLKMLSKDIDILEIYLEYLDLGPEWQKKGEFLINKRVGLDSKIINNLLYVDINSPEDSYVNVKQYMAHFKIVKKEDIRLLDVNDRKDNNVLERVSKEGYKNEKKIVNEKILKEEMVGEEDRNRFGPVLTVIDYSPDIEKLMKIDTIKDRIEERKKWLPNLKDKDLFYLIFAPIRFLRFKQNILIKNYQEGGRLRPSIVGDIRDNSLLGGIWDYKDIEYLVQIDLMVKNGIIVPTDFNFYGPPYSILYKAVRDGILLVGGIEHNFDAPREEFIVKNGIKTKIRKPGHFITYTCMKRMGPEGTQVLIILQNQLNTTNKMLTCKELDMDMVGLDMGGNK